MAALAVCRRPGEETDGEVLWPGVGWSGSDRSLGEEGCAGRGRLGRSEREDKVAARLADHHTTDPHVVLLNLPAHDQWWDKLSPLVPHERELNGCQCPSRSGRGGGRCAQSD